jgi:hypothetical protein
LKRQAALRIKNGQRPSPPLSIITGVTSVKENKMLETIVVVLVILWLLGMVSSYTMGGFIHILLVVAIVVILIRVISGRRAL